MELIVKSRGEKVPDQDRKHIEQKLGRLERYMDQISKATVEISEEQRRNEGQMHRAQVTVTGAGGVLLRAEGRATELHAAIDIVTDTLQRQIERYKDKHWRRGRQRRQGNEFVSAPDLAPAEREPAAPRIVRTKEFQVKPMFTDEALEQMELLGHAFFVFRDAETEMVNVLYRREDGNYGLIAAT